MNRPVCLTTRLEEAEAAFRRGDDAGCIGACRATITMVGRTAPVLHLLGSALVRAGEGAAGVDALTEALAQEPESLLLRLDTASALDRHGDVEGAIAVLVAGVAHHCGNPDLASHLGGLLSDHGRHEEALAVLTAGVHAAPDNLPLRGLLAAELAGALRFDGALTHLHRVAERAPLSSEIRVNLGVLYQSMGDLDSAIDHYDTAIRLMPDNALAHVNLATALLTRLDLPRAWKEFEWRLRLPTIRALPSDLPRWQGDDLDGRRLLVTAEQGYGDMIQFARFLPQLRDKRGTVIVECPPPLARLLAGVDGVDACTIAGETLPAADVTASLISLPFLLDSATSAIGMRAPYIPSPGVVRSAPDTGRRPLKVGLVWAGLPARGEVFVRRALNRRSCRLADLAPLAEVPGVEWHSLQIGPAAGELRDSPFPMEDLTDGIDDFVDTATRMAGLDLVISVDTAAAHLAGASGIPLWVLLAPGQCDYRWGTGATSPWYPAARLFRADQSGWPAVAERVAAQLREGSLVRRDARMGG